jgi:hypothetical protein
MPRGKELEQLPMSNVAPGAGDNKSKYNREYLGGMTEEERPYPSKAKDENKK